MAARVELGGLLLQRGRLAQAAAVCQEALEILPGYSEAALVLAQAERLRGRVEEAVAVLVEILSGDAFDVPALVQLGAALLDAGRAVDARRALQRALRLDPASLSGHLQLGRVAEAEGFTREALDSWRRVVSLGEGSAEAQEAVSRAESLLERVQSAHSSTLARTA